VVVVALMLILEKAGPRGRSRLGMVSVMAKVWMGGGPCEMACVDVG
jgi:hypothetical protein